jgi:hypothetical protein
MPFAKGKSGNPGGRPKGHGDIRDMARQHTSAAIDTLIAIMSDATAPAASRVSAADAILSRGWGRPTQAIAGAAGEEPLHVSIVRWSVSADQSLPGDSGG